MDSGPSPGYTIATALGPIECNDGATPARGFRPTSRGRASVIWASRSRSCWRSSARSGSTAAAARASDAVLRQPPAALGKIFRARSYWIERNPPGPGAPQNDRKVERSEPANFHKLSLQKLSDDVNYAMQLSKGHLELLSYYGQRLEGLRVLELGPGKNLAPQQRSESDQLLGRLAKKPPEPRKRSRT
jgi:hypothetical protein